MSKPVRRTQTGKPKVLVAIPTHDGRIGRDVATWLARWSAQSRVSVDMIIRQGRPCDLNRNRIADAMLKSSDAQWLLTVDEDNPPLRDPMDFVFMGKYAIACPTPFWNLGLTGSGVSWGCYDWHPEFNAFQPHTPCYGLQPVDGFSLGCVVIARKVLEALGPECFTVKTDGLQVVRGTDLAFCDRARAAGFELWAHYGYPCHHYKTIDVLEIAQARPGWRLPWPTPKTEPWWNNDGQLRPFPYMALEHAERIRRVVCANGPVRIIEWGSGGSTLWLAYIAPPDSFLLSIEHDAKWHTRVRDMLSKVTSGVAVQLVEASRLFEYAIQSVTAEFAIAIVDGKNEWRPDCLRAAVRRLKPGGHLFLHDAHKDEYQEAKEELINQHGFRLVDESFDEIGVSLWHAIAP